MKVKEFIEDLKSFPEDAEVCFYNSLRGDDMYFKAISISDEGDEIYINIIY